MLIVLKSTVKYPKCASRTEVLEVELLHRVRSDRSGETSQNRRSNRSSQGGAYSCWSAVACVRRAAAAGFDLDEGRSFLVYTVVAYIVHGYPGAAAGRYAFFANYEKIYSIKFCKRYMGYFYLLVTFLEISVSYFL